MMRRWIGPVAVALVLAIVTYFITLSRTPQTLMSAAVSRMEKLGGINTFGHMPLATDKSRAVVRPSPDLAYSACPFDLSQGPLAISAAPVPANYWSLSVFQANTDNIEARGQAMQIVVAQPGQATPPGAAVVRVNGARGVALIRILVDDPARFPAIDAARRGSTCKTIAAG